MNHKWLIQWTLFALLNVVRSRESFNTLPPPIKTSFTCSGRSTGFYADREMNCRIYHMCDDYNNKFTYYCPEDTAFRQEASICDHAHLVDCHKDANNSISSIENSASAEVLDTAGDDSRHSYTRSFHINSKSQKPVQLKNKYATFSLSSSIFLRDPTRNEATTPSSERDNSEITRRNNFVPKATVRPQIIKTTNRPVAKNDKIETPASKFQKGFPGFPGINLLFLQPPPVRTDNNYVAGETTTKIPVTVEPIFKKRFDSAPSPSVFSSGGLNKVPSVNYTNEKVKDIKIVLEPPKFESGPTFNARNSNYAYMETLRSMQEGITSKSPTTTTTKTPPTIPPSPKLPVVIFTAPLKPLIPNKLEFDPYYPYYPTTTEVYYTPRDSVKARKPFQKTTRKDYTIPKLEIPTVLPDLNSLEDLVDRKKLFFIPSTHLT